MRRLDLALFEELAVLLSPYGFSKSRDPDFDDTFVRQVGMVRQGLNVDTSIGVQGVLAVPDTASIRLDPVEEMVSRIEEENPSSRHSQIVSSGNRRTFIIRCSDAGSSQPAAGSHGWDYSPVPSFSMRSAAEVPDAARSITAYAIDHMFPILTQLSDIDHALGL